MRMPNITRNLSCLTSFNIDNRPSVNDLNIIYRGYVMSSEPYVCHIIIPGSLETFGCFYVVLVAIL